MKVSNEIDAVDSFVARRTLSRDLSVSDAVWGCRA